MALSLLAACSLLLGACASPAPAPSLTAQEAALYVFSPEKQALIQMEADLSTPAREVRLDLPPACSLTGLYPAPGGERLAAELACPNGPLALLIDPATGEAAPFPVGEGVDSHFLAWAADGRTAYLRVNAFVDPRLLAVDAVTLRRRALPLDPYTYDLAAAPDGESIVFSYSRGLGFGSEMHIARSDGTDARPLGADPANILAFARWSPDEESIAFITIPDTQTPYSVGGLWLTTADGANLRRLADADAGHGYAPAWSPDGTRLAFVARANPEDPAADVSLEALISHVVLVDVGTGALQQVTAHGEGRAGAPVWSPDGNTLGFEYVLDGRMEVQIADLTGSTPFPIQAIPAVCCPVWMRK